MNPKEIELMDAVQQAQAAARKVFVAAFDYNDEHGEPSAELCGKYWEAQAAWDKARNELENYRYTTYGPY